jgi:Uncharacterized protein conserved in bacteria (DUF2312)
MHTNLFRFLGGVPKFVVCDNLKAAVTNPDRYDPWINRTYAEMAGHYGTAILAARPRRPKDKAKVEVAVQIAQRWVLARQNRLSQRPSVEVFAEAKGDGFDVKILKEIIKLRKQDQEERDERESMLDLCMRAMEQARSRDCRP